MACHRVGWKFQYPVRWRFALSEEGHRPSIRRCCPDAKRPTNQSEKAVWMFDVRAAALVVRNLLGDLFLRRAIGLGNGVAFGDFALASGVPGGIERSRHIGASPKPMHAGAQITSW